MAIWIPMKWKGSQELYHYYLHFGWQFKISACNFGGEKEKRCESIEGDQSKNDANEMDHWVSVEFFPM